jgi:hypothetical protein
MKPPQTKLPTKFEAGVVLFVTLASNVASVIQLYARSSSGDENLKLNVYSSCAVGVVLRIKEEND